MPRICITGGAGFIGYHAGIALKKSGYDVIVHYNNSKNEAEMLVNKI